MSGGFKGERQCKVVYEESRLETLNFCLGCKFKGKGACWCHIFESTC